MSDKEYRRRKKRKEGQRKDDMLPEEQSFVPQKSEQRDSDQENEDDHYVVDHQPSKTAKIIFLLLFSVLVAATSGLLLALRGAERGPADIFETDHHDSIEILHGEEISVLHEGITGGPVDIFETDHHDSIEILHGEEISVLHEGITGDNSLEHPSLDVSSSNDVEEASETLELENEIHIDSRDEETLNIIAENEDHMSPMVNAHSTIEDLIRDDTDSMTEDQLTITTEESMKTTVEDFQSEENIEENTPSDSLSGLETVSSEEQDILLESPSSSVYENQDITNEMDFSIRQELDEIEKLSDRSPDKALLKYENILRLHPYSPRAHYGKAMILDQMAENERSNTLLEQAIESYTDVLSQKEVPERLYLLAGTRAVDRMRFRGYIQKPLKLLMSMSERFPMNMDLKKQIGVCYLMIGQNKQAKKVFDEVLSENQNDGFAKVHSGFILKTDENNYDDAVKLLSEGIASNEPGVIDGRFFFHLGDALSRLGRGTEAMEVYENGVQKGVFLSAYQRSFYNVKGLTGQAWWNPESTPFVHFIRLLESNWITIKNEAVALINENQSGFLPESEGLQMKGNWKQYELFARGRKNVKNCALTPFTCALVDGMPDAAGCKRGQVKFSLMEPGTHVWAHTGPTNCRLRAHLGLIVPPGAKIRVVKDIREWKEGKVIMFDDSFEHEVWHNGNSLRLILIVDFWHPELTAYQKATLSPI